QDVDRGSERRTDGTVLHLAVPPPVLELLDKQAGDYGIHVLVEVSALCDDPAIDAWLNFAAEERLPRILPTATVSDHRNRSAYTVRVRINSEIMQQLERWQCGDPWLALALDGLIDALRWEAGASRPLAVFALQV